jgi:hypothetical protein
MVTMVDEIYDRAYQSARADLNDGLRALFSGLGRAIGQTLKVRHRIEWSAPWDAPKKPARRV